MDMQMRTAGELASLVQGAVLGDPDIEIVGVASIKDAQTGDITFAETDKFIRDAHASGASAILVPNSPEVVALSPAIGIGAKVFITVDNPRLAFTQLLDLFAPVVQVERSIHETAVLEPGVKVGENVAIGANVVIGSNVRIGNNVTILPLAYIGADVEIADGVVIHPNVSVLHGTLIGARTIIHSGAVLGADGFGYLQVDGHHRKVAQIGHVIIGSDVEIGANVTIDRAKTGATKIGNGTKLDNMVHVGHNCQIGDDVLIVAQVGLGGGVQIANNAIIAGQAGIKEQVKVGPHAIIGAQSAVLRDVPAGTFVSGSPARPHRETLRGYASMMQGSDLQKQVASLIERIAALEAQLGQPSA
jgi:UDP-3-O-[3-hydroxymyristoyl] glucosamine N-acyltransferase